MCLESAFCYNASRRLLQSGYGELSVSPAPDAYFFSFSHVPTTPCAPRRAALWAGQEVQAALGGLNRGRRSSLRVLAKARLVISTLCGPDTFVKLHACLRGRAWG